jgi:hypothetical protein
LSPLEAAAEVMKMVKTMEMAVEVVVVAMVLVVAVVVVVSVEMEVKKAVELTEELKKIDPLDPVKFDFALYGMGIEEKTIWK